MPNAGEDVAKQEPSFTAGGKAKWYRHKRHGQNVNAYCLEKEANLKRLYTV